MMSQCRPTIFDDGPTNNHGLHVRSDPLGELYIFFTRQHTYMFILFLFVLVYSMF